MQYKIILGTTQLSIPTRDAHGIVLLVVSLVTKGRVIDQRKTTTTTTKTIMKTPQEWKGQIKGKWIIKQSKPECCHNTNIVVIGGTGGG